MSEIVDQLLEQLKSSLINSPHLAVMILDKRMTVVWHNKRFGEEFRDSGTLIGKRCFDITAAGKPHAGCPLKISQTAGKNTKGFFDFGDRLFFFLTIPLKDGYAAKVHAYLPKTDQGRIEEV